MLAYTKCPKCGNEDWGDSISGGDYEEDGDIWKEYLCGKCNFEWREVYNFSHCESLYGEKLDGEGNIIQ